MVHNHKEIMKTIKIMGFSHSFSINYNIVNIIQQGDNFELRINNQVFSHLMNQERSRSEFNYDDHQPSYPRAPKRNTDTGMHLHRQPQRAQPQREEENFDTGFGFADGFSKFDYRPKEQPQTK